MEPTIMWDVLEQTLSKRKATLLSWPIVSIVLGVALFSNQLFRKGLRDTVYSAQQTPMYPQFKVRRNTRLISISLFNSNNL